MGDEIIVNFQDSLLRKSDADLLEENGWLNDRLIGFWFEYLYHEVCHNDSSVTLVGPEVTHFIKLASQQEVKLFIEPLELSKKQLILLPINDSLAPDCPGGTHWSLLIYDAQKKTFYHLDSFENQNYMHALKVSRKLELENSQLVSLESSHQENFSDCGIYVCCNAELVLKHMCSNNASTLTNIPKLKSSDAQGQRIRMKNVIKSLTKSN